MQGRRSLTSAGRTTVAAAVEPTSGIGLTHTAYYQPRFDDFGDYRILGETAAVLDVKKRLAVKLAFSAIYDSRPADDVEKLDTTITTSLLFRINP